MGKIGYYQNIYLRMQKKKKKENNRSKKNKKQFPCHDTIGQKNKNKRGK